MITKDSPKDFVKKLGKKCSKCSHCCSYGTGFLEPNDLKRIASHLNMSEDNVKKHYLEEVEMFHTSLLRPKKMKEPFGKCVFLKAKECAIHSAKPLHCRIANCLEHGNAMHQWFMLNFAVNENDPQSIREWAQYIEFKHPIPGGELNNLVKDKEKLKKILEYKIM